MNTPKNIGVHLRFQDTLAQVADEAAELGLAIFQFFLTKSNKESYGKHALLTKQDIAYFLAAQKKNQTQTVIHSSYWINLATGKKDRQEHSQLLLRREFEMAARLHVPHLVLHPGSATGYELPVERDNERKSLGIAALTGFLNQLLPHYPEITLVLENTAHGNSTIGSDLLDFALIKQQLNRPEQVKYCIDFAHAHAFGYNLADHEDFLAQIDQTLGLANLALIHFNDSSEEHGSLKDQHAIPGEGLIGKKILQPYLHHAALQHIPKILELPKLPPEKIQSVLLDIGQW